MDINTSNSINFNPADQDRLIRQDVERAAQAEQSAVEAALGGEYGPTVARALATDTTIADQLAVQQAITDIQNGTLDTPKNITMAAQRILMLGI